MRMWTSERTRLAAIILVSCAAGCGLLLGIESHELGGGADASTETTTGNEGGGGGDAGNADGGDKAIETLATGQNQPRAIAIDSTRVFWVNEGDGTVMSSPKTGGGASVFAKDAATPRAIAVDSTDVFWNSDTNGNCAPENGIWRGKSTGGSAVTIVTCTDSAGHVVGIAIDGNNLYWSESTQRAVFGVQKVGAARFAVSGDIGNAPGAVAVNATAVYWTNPGAQNVGAYSKLDGGVGVLVTGLQGPAAIAADDDLVYVATLAAVQKIPASGGAAAQLGPTLNSPSALATTPTHVYVATSGDGTIRRISKANGTVEVLATGQGGPRALAVDDTGLYWANDSGEIRRRPF